MISTMIEPEIYTSKRLLFRRLTADDAQAVFDGWASDVQSTQWMGWKRHETLTDTLAFIADSDMQWERDGIGPFVMELRKAESSEPLFDDEQACQATTIPALVGSSSFRVTNPDNAADELELGYIFAPSFWGQGFAGETLSAMMDYARSRRYRRLIARVHGDNAASDRVLIKHGWTEPVTPLPRGSCPNLKSQDYLQLDYELVLE